MSANFVFGGISIGGATGGSDTPGVPTEWPVDNATGIVSRITPDPQVDSQSNPFNFVGGSFDFSGTEDFVVRLGHNVAQGGANEDPSRAMLADEWEQDYLTGAGIRVSERHLAHKGDYIGATLRRPMSFFLRNDADPAIDPEYAVEFELLKLSQKWNDVKFVESDLTSGLRTRDVPIGTDHTITTVAHLNLRGPTGQTANFMQCAKNSGQFFTMNGYGEITLNTTTTGTDASGANAALDVQGRTQTPYSLAVRSANGTERLVVESANGTGAMRSASTYIHWGTFRLFDSTGATERVQFGSNGNVFLMGALTAGGNSSSFLGLGATAGPRIYAGSGAPSISAAAIGSLYLRSDGSGVNDRMYVATNTSGGWTAVVTVA